MKTGDADSFERLGTLGIEEEFYIVDDDGNPRSATDELVYESDPPPILEGRLDHELFPFTIETHTPVIESIDAAPAVLAEVRDALVEHAGRHGHRIATAGLHPTAQWRDFAHADKPRYRSQLDRIQYPQHRNLTAGLHIHVGVDDADKAMWVANEIRWSLPILLALSVNSPYWSGHDTGLHSARALLFEGLPNTGIPTAFSTYADFDRFERAMVNLGAVHDRGEIWFDVRPHSALGTVEIRSPDAQRDPDNVLALVEYAHALVLHHAKRYERGEATTPVRREFLDVNKWRALRYGREASFIHADGSDTVSLVDVVEADCERLGVCGIRTLLETESGAARQRRIARTSGLEAVCRDLIL